MDNDLRAADLSMRKSSASDDQDVEETIDLSMRHWQSPNSMATDSHHGSQMQQHDNPPSESFNGVPSRSRSGRPSRYNPAESPGSNSPDIVILSDEEPKINGHINGYSTDSRADSPASDRNPVKLKLSEEEMQEHNQTIHRLREVLRNEEMKLVLLKKLRQSQNLKESVLAPGGGSAGMPSAGKLPSSSVNRVGSTSNNNNTMPPYIRSSLLGKSQHLQPQSSTLNHLAPSHSNLSRALGSTSNSLVQQSLMRSGVGGLPRTPVTTPPNVIMGYPIQGSKIAATTSYLSSIQNQVTVTQVPSTLSPLSQTQVQQERLDVQTPAQKQAAAKLALRKQLEKTLLQIPPPKPPPPEMHFIPNANNQEFVYLVGLEVVVGLLIGDEQTARPPPDPFECIQCRTDFTPVWKWQDANAQRRKPSVICETCVTSNIKKALKAEHTNRLKTAFVKALQQEQEIEQRMQATSPPPTSSTPPVQLMSQQVASSTPPTSHSPIPHDRHDRGMGRLASSSAAAVAAAVANSAALLQHIPKLSAAHQSFLQAQHLQQFTQGLSHNQPQPAHMLPFGPLLAAQAYSYQMLGKSSVSSSELQRQYLLDMIPPRSIPQSTTMNWKT